MDHPASNRFASLMSRSSAPDARRYSPMRRPERLEDADLMPARSHSPICAASSSSTDGIPDFARSSSVTRKPGLPRDAQASMPDWHDFLLTGPPGVASGS
jgi:hypothetical protein